MVEEVDEEDTVIVRFFFFMCLVGVCSMSLSKPSGSDGERRGKNTVLYEARHDR